MFFEQTDTAQRDCSNSLCRSEKRQHCVFLEVFYVRLIQPWISSTEDVGLRTGYTYLFFFFFEEAAFAMGDMSSDGNPLDGNTSNLNTVLWRIVRM